MGACFAARLLFALAARNRQLSALRAWWTPLLGLLTHTWQVYVFHAQGVLLSSSRTSICLPALAFLCVAQVYVFHGGAVGYLQRAAHVLMYRPTSCLQVYVFHSATLKAVLSANEKLKHLEEQLVPHMIRYQVRTWLA